jgi:nucleotide-binding universal stress UspA family protein
MSYRTIVVGTDGSETSLMAVDEAARIASEAGATLIVATAHPRSAAPSRGGPDPDQQGGENYRTAGNAPLYDMLDDAADRARKAGATNVETRAVEGSAAEALVALAAEVDADLIVVGSVGANSIVGRLVGSVPRAVRRDAKTEVRVVETT